MRYAVQLLRGLQIAPEGFLHDHTCIPGKTCGAEFLNHCFKERWRDGKVVRGALRCSKRLFDCDKGPRILVIAAYILEPGQQVAKSALIGDPNSDRLMLSATRL